MSTEGARFAEYDPLAWVYARHWGHVLSSQIEPVLDRLVLADVPAGAAILDLCCGTGDLAALLTSRGYRVTGLDGSAEMLRIARERAPDATFVLADARAFDVPAPFHAVLSTFDSLNHMTTADDLASVFRHVHAALAPGGVFLFDLNTEAGYLERWGDDFSFVEDDHAVIVQVEYEPAAQIGRFEAAVFRREPGATEGWRRTDVVLTQRPYADNDVRGALGAAGFDDVRSYDAESDLGLDGHVGRVFYRCERRQTVRIHASDSEPRRRD